ncbi:MAG: trigger factor [Patescibacteria group bacterium]
MNKKTTSTFSKLDNGNIEIIFTIPIDLIAINREIVIKKMAKDIVVPGFRKGMAPITRVAEKIDPDKINEQILGLILPLAFADSVKEHKFNPAIYPKFEAVKIGQGSEWQIKAITCELPQIKLPNNYKKNLKKDSKNQNILIKSLLETIKLEIPRVLIEEEVNARLSQVLDRIEKLGLALESYLKSVGKTAEILRAEYEMQAKDAISLELILNAIADDEKIGVSETEIDDFIKTTGSELKQVEKGQRDILKCVLLRKSALEKLAK